MGKALFQKAKAQYDDSLALIQSIMHVEAARTLNINAEVNSLLSSILTENARVALRKEDTLGALEYLTRAIEYDRKTSLPLNLAGIIYFRKGRIEKATVLFDRAIELDSTDVSSCFNRGMVSWHKGELNNAHGFWFRALRNSPGDEEILYWFARAEKKIRDQEIYNVKVQEP